MVSRKGIELSRLGGGRMDDGGGRYYGLRAHMVRDAGGAAETFSTHLGYHADRDEAERTVMANAGGGGSPLDTGTRKLVYLELSAYQAGGREAVETMVFDRWGGRLTR